MDAHWMTRLAWAFPTTGCCKPSISVNRVAIMAHYSTLSSSHSSMLTR
jgi:hypothetical protein